MLIAVSIRRFALLLTFALTSSLAARADEASHRAKAQEMMSLLHTQRMVENISASLKKQVVEAAENVGGPNPSDEQKTKIADLEKQADLLIDAELSWDLMKSTFTDIYTRNFTEEELDGIIAFYKTPTGATLLAKMPDVNTQVQQFGASRLAPLQPKLKDLFEDFRKSQATAPPTLGGPDAAPAPLSTTHPPSTPK